MHYRGAPAQQETCGSFQARILWLLSGTGSKEDSSDKDSCMETSQIERVTSGESAEPSGRTDGARTRSTSDFFHDGASNWIINFSELVIPLDCASCLLQSPATLCQIRA